MSTKKTRGKKKAPESEPEAEGAGAAEEQPTKKAKTGKAKTAKPKATKGKKESKAKDKGKQGDADGETKETAAEGGPEMVKPRFKLDLFKNSKGISLAFSIVYVSDPKRSLEFYQNVFGFELRERHGDEWIALHAGNTALALHKVPAGKKLAGKGLIAGQAGPGFFVPDLEAFHKVAVENGAKVLEPPTKQPWGGFKAEYADPDGIPSSVVEVKPDQKFE